MTRYTMMFKQSARSVQQAATCTHTHARTDICTVTCCSLVLMLILTDIHVPIAICWNEGVSSVRANL